MPRPRLVHVGQHAVAPAQDLGPRRRHLHAADRPLAEGDRGPRRTAPRPGPRDRHRADPARPGRRQAPGAWNGAEPGVSKRGLAPSQSAQVASETRDGEVPVPVLKPEPPPLPGRSLVPSFAHDGSTQREFLFFHHEGNRALRMGRWKIVSAPEDDNAWQLYDLASDRCEAVDLARDQPDRAGRWRPSGRSWRPNSAVRPVRQRRRNREEYGDPQVE